MILQLEVEMLRPEDGEVVQRRLLRLRIHVPGEVS